MNNKRYIKNISLREILEVELVRETEHFVIFSRPDPWIKGKFIENKKAKHLVTLYRDKEKARLSLVETLKAKVEHHHSEIQKLRESLEKLINE